MESEIKIMQEKNISEINTRNCVTINLFLWVSSSVQIWKPPSLFGFFSFFVADFFGTSGCSVSMVWDSFSAFSPVSTLKTKHNRLTVHQHQKRGPTLYCIVILKLYTIYW